MATPEVEQLVEQARFAAADANTDDVLTRLDQALDQSQTPGDRGLLLVAKAVAGQHTQPREEAALMLAEAIPLLRESGDMESVLSATTHAAAIALLMNEAQQCMDLAVEALILLNDERLDGKLIPAAASNLSLIFREYAAFELAFELAEQAFRTSQEIATTAGALISAFNVAHTALEGRRRLDNLSPAERQRWLDVADEAAQWILESGIGDTQGKVMGHDAAAEVSRERGDLGAARHHIDLALRDVDQTNELLLGYVSMTNGLILRDEGEYEAAADQFAHAIGAFGDDHIHLVRVLLERSDAHAKNGNHALALEDTKQLLTLELSRQTQHIGRMVGQVRERAKLEQTRLLLVDETNSLTEQMRLDDLTGLASRSWLEVSIDRLAEGPGNVAVLVLDLDNFKGVNDRFGHLAGDEVLRRVADIFRTECRDGDLVARYGGEEFVVIPARGSLAGAGSLAERLRQAVERADWSDIHPDFRLTTSAGVAVGPSSLVRDVLRRADDALYGAKARGRNRVVGALVERLAEPADAVGVA